MIEFQIFGTEKVMSRLRRVTRSLKGENIKAMRKAVIEVSNRAKRDYMSEGRMDYPKPADAKLSVQSGRLRSSITTKVEGRGPFLIGTVGTNVVYGRIHEYGGFAGRGGTVKIEARPYLSRALKDARPIILRLLGQSVQNTIRRT